MPSASVDANGNIYVVYTAEVEGTYGPSGDMNDEEIRKRDIYLVWSNDGGHSWSKEINICAEIAFQQEGIYGSGHLDESFPDVPQRVGSDQKLHILWNSDPFPDANFYDYNEIPEVEIDYYGLDVSTLIFESATQVQLDSVTTNFTVSDTNLNVGDTTIISIENGFLCMDPYIPFYEYISDTTGIVDSIDVNASNDSIRVIIDSNSLLLNFETKLAGSCEVKNQRVLLNTTNGPLQAHIDPDSIQICLGDTIELYGYGSGDTAYNYEWWGLDSAQSILVSPDQNTTYYLSVGGIIDSILVKVGDIPPVDAGENQTISYSSNSGSNCLSLPFVFLGTPQDWNLYDYSWSPLVGFDWEEAKNPQIIARPQISTSYTLTVRDTATGCPNSDEVNVIVSGDFNLDCWLSAPEEQVLANIQLFPNPAHNHINLFSDYPIQEYQVYNVTGNVIEAKTIRGNEVSINTSNWSHGIYFLKVKSSNQWVSKKFLVE